MVKATIKMDNGTSVLIEGENEEVAKLIKKISGNGKEPLNKNASARKSRNTLKISISDLVAELKEEGFFDQPRSLVEIKGAFANKGRIYDINAISTPILRVVRKRELGRVDQGGKWAYVKR